MLAGMPSIKRGRPVKRFHDGTFSLADAGLDKKTSHRWQSITSIPEAVFEKFVRETVEAANEPKQQAAHTDSFSTSRRRHSCHLHESAGSLYWGSDAPEFTPACCNIGPFDVMVR